jgi:hypothetical protein
MQNNETIRQDIKRDYTTNRENTCTPLCLSTRYYQSLSPMLDRNGWWRPLIELIEYGSGAKVEMLNKSAVVEL